MGTDPARRWVRVGHSSDVSPRQAGIAATRVARDGPDPKLLLVFASWQYAMPELVGGVAEAAGEIPVIGCTGTGEIGPGRLEHPPRPGVVVIGFGGDFDVATTCQTDFNQRPRQVGEDVATALMPLPDREHQVVLMFTDDLSGDQQDLIRGAYGVLGATVPLVGGVAGDDIRIPLRSTSWQIFNGKIVKDAVVAACIGTDGPIGLAVHHGWQCHGDAMMVTASSGNEVYTLDDRPALDVFLDRHRAPAGIENDPAAFGAFGLTRPLAIVRRGAVAVRHVLGARPDARALICAAGVPNGAAVWLATGDVASTLDAADAAAEEAIAALGGARPLAVLFIDCAGRRAVLGQKGMAEERAVMRRRAGSAPIAGFYSKGEIARASGASGFHNQTIVAFAVG